MKLIFKALLTLMAAIGLSALSVAQQPSAWVAIDDHTGQAQFAFEVAGDAVAGEWSIIDAVSLPAGYMGRISDASDLAIFQINERALAIDLQSTKGRYQGVLRLSDIDNNIWSGILTNELDHSIRLLIEPELSGLLAVGGAEIDYAEFSDFWILYDDEMGEPLARLELLRGDSTDAGGFYQIFDRPTSPLGFSPPSARSDVSIHDGQLIGKFPTGAGTFTLFMTLIESAAYEYEGLLRLDNAMQDVIPVSLKVDNGGRSLPPIPALWEIASGVNIAASDAMGINHAVGHELGEPLDEVSLYTCQESLCFYDSPVHDLFLVDVPLLQGWSVIEEASWDALPRLLLRNTTSGDTIRLNPMNDEGDDLACFRIEEGGDDLLCQPLNAREETADLVDTIMIWRQAQIDADIGAELYDDI